jgi:ADP-ribose pyrophosphatase
MTDALKPWTVLASRDVYAAEPWLKVRVETLELPDGRRVEFHQVDQQDFIIVFAETADGQALMLRQYKHGARRVSLTFPAGAVDPGEDPLEAAKRELLEETGYVSDDWISFGDYAMQGNQRGCVAHMFQATGCRKVAEADSGDLEEMRLELLTREELIAAAGKGEFAILSSLCMLTLVLQPEVAKALGRRVG